MVTPSFEKKEKFKTIVNILEGIKQNIGQVPHRNFYYVTLLVLLVQQFSLIRFQVSNCHISGAYVIDSATSRYMATKVKS